MPLCCMLLFKRFGVLKPEAKTKRVSDIVKNFELSDKYSQEPFFIVNFDFCNIRIYITDSDRIFSLIALTFESPSSSKCGPTFVAKTIK